MRTCRICGGTHQHLYANGSQFIHAECLPPKPHWENPWKDAVPVPIEALAECALGIGKSWGDYTVNPPTSFIMTKEIMLEHWMTVGNRFPNKDAKLDAYILPQSSGLHSIGIRYGAEGSQYLSPAADQEKVAALLQKYQELSNEKV